MWDYIKQWNSFLNTSLETLSCTEFNIYARLFQINNNQGRNEWFQAKYSILAYFTGLSVKSVSLCINSLQQKGFIEVRKGKKSAPSEFKLVILYENNVENKAKNFRLKGNELVTNRKQNGNELVTKGKQNGNKSTPPALENSGSRDPIKDKVKDKVKVKEKDINTPIPPKGGEVDIFGEYVAGSIDLLQTLDDFEGMRKTLKKPMTERAKKLLCSKLTKLAGDDTKLKIALLEQSILHSWLDVYPLRDEEPKPKGGSMRGKDNNGGYDSDNKAKIGGLDDFDRADQNQKYPWEV